MFVNKIVKTQCPDQQLDDYVLENSVLKSKLQSKIDALSIMSTELDKCCMERDRYKILVEQLKDKKTGIDDLNLSNKFAPTNTISVGEILAKTKEQNNVLKLEVETLKCKLDEAHGDIVVLRKQLYKNKEKNDAKANLSVDTTYSILDYEQLVQELEKVQTKYRQMQMDYRATLDEKEELVSDRDYYKNKVQKLNHQISFLLTNRTKHSKAKVESDTKANPLVDRDVLVMENKYLHESITQMQVEKEIITRTLTKYKALLDRRSKNDSMNFKKGFPNVMTQKQVQEYLDPCSKSGLKRASIKEIKSLCLGLFEALNDKSIALQHQRKTNQILANRIADMEKTMESWCDGQNCIPVFPSKLLIEEFLNDSTSIKSGESGDTIDVDRDVMSYENYFNSDCSVVNTTNGACFDDIGNVGNMTRVVLPEELQQLVTEALAELKT